MRAGLEKNERSHAKNLVQELRNLPQLKEIRIPFCLEELASAFQATYYYSHAFSLLVESTSMQDAYVTRLRQNTNQTPPEQLSYFSAQLSLLKSLNTRGLIAEKLGFYEDALSSFSAGYIFGKSGEGKYDGTPLEKMTQLIMAKAAGNMAGVFEHMGKYEEAQSHHILALNTRRKYLDPNDPDLAFSYNNLGTFHLNNGQMDKAAENIEAAAAVLRGSELLKETYQISIPIYLNLANVQLLTGRYDRSLDSLRKAESLL